MKYEEFKESIKIAAEELAGKGGKVDINKVTKNNGLILDGLIILRKGTNVSPTIYLNGYYHQYAMGRSMDDIISEITDGYYDSIARLKINMDFYRDYENVSDRIIYKLVNYEKNKKLLEMVPHRKILDLALVFCCMIANDETGSATTLVYNSHLEMWNVTEKEIYERSLINTPKLLKCNIRAMADILTEFMDDEGFDIQEELPEIDETNMYVLTNGIRTNGAACILYQNVLKEFSEKVDADLFIIPSSVHEVIIIPKEKQYTKEGLADMVHEVNKEGVSSDEILSDNVYTYNRKNNCISM